MSVRPSVAVVTGVLLLLLSCATLRVSAHRLDEYLLDTTFSIHPDRVDGEMRLTPGVAVLKTVLPEIDTNGDGLFSDAERQAYAQRVLGDLSLSVDAAPLRPRLVSATYPAVEDAREGVGEIVVRFDAPLPAGGATRRLNFENRHERPIAAYMVNSLVPTDTGVRLGRQERSQDQSAYRIEFTLAAPKTATWRAMRFWLALDGIALVFAAAMLWRRRRANLPARCEISS